MGIEGSKSTFCNFSFDMSGHKSLYNNIFKQNICQSLKILPIIRAWESKNVEKLAYANVSTTHTKAPKRQLSATPISADF